MKKYMQAGELDAEWVELIKEAKKIGLTAEEVRTFLKKNGGQQITT